jgi:hypothetical protein
LRSHLRARSPRKMFRLLRRSILLKTHVRDSPLREIRIIVRSVGSQCHSSSLICEYSTYSSFGSPAMTRSPAGGASGYDPSPHVLAPVV